MASVLTQQMILRKSRQCDLEEVRKINFINHSLTDINEIRFCNNLESATFSGNYIKKLDCFQGMTRLQELSVAKNNIKDLREVDYLSSCINLRILWLKENPICHIPSYRQYVIRAIPSLVKLDDVDICREERQMANNGGSSDYYPSSQENNYNNNEFRRKGSTPINDYNQGHYAYYNNMNNNKARGRTPIEGKRVMSPYYNNEENMYGRYNNNYKVNEYEDYRNVGGRPFERKSSQEANNPNRYERYGRQIPNSAEGHVRNYGNRNPMEVSSIYSEQRTVDVISLLIKSLNTDELLYLKEHIDKKIKSK